MIAGFMIGYQAVLGGGGVNLHLCHLHFIVPMLLFLPFPPRLMIHGSHVKTKPIGRPAAGPLLGLINNAKKRQPVSLFETRPVFVLAGPSNRRLEVCTSSAG